MKKFGFLIVMASMGLLVISCSSQATPVATPISTETILLTATPTITVTATLATSTPVPTNTPRPTRIPEWITNFAEPVLTAIANLPPTYQDDFSNPRSGWYNGTTSGHPDVLIEGEKRYFEGEYRLIANGATSKYPTVCSGVEDGNAGRYADFVVEFDVRFVSGRDGDWQIQFHRTDIGLYTLTMNINWNEVGFTKCSPETGPACGGIAKYSGNKLHSGLEWNHILMIVRGPKMAAYANGAPVLYHEDKTYTDKFNKGYFSLNSCNAGTAPLETRWDNFKVWDISKLP